MNYCAFVLLFPKCLGGGWAWLFWFCEALVLSIGQNQMCQRGWLKIFSLCCWLFYFFRVVQFRLVGCLPVGWGRPAIATNGLAMNSTGANYRLLSATHIAKSFCFVFSFPCLKQNPKDFADIIKIHKPCD